MLARYVRKLMNRLILGRDRGGDLDHVPVGREDDDARARRARQLRVARERRGSAFLCAAKDQDREVMVVPGTFRTIAAGRVPTAGMVEAATVARLHRRSSG